MGTNECSQPASKSSWDSQDFGDISMVLKMAHIFASPPGHYELTHWSRVTHICVSTQTIIGSNDGLSPGRRQAII